MRRIAGFATVLRHCDVRLRRCFGDHRESNAMPAEFYSEAKIGEVNKQTPILEPFGTSQRPTPQSSNSGLGSRNQFGERPRFQSSNPMFGGSRPLETDRPSTSGHRQRPTTQPQLEDDVFDEEKERWKP
ncbi:unnamed protein product [Bursaphelenchus xylophilus]|uniref:(pine wood nematode) hypothetical protein n=1 Tax=Bursaphelenchus xylophilus TaxID=6326 RepID=A0A7I8X351_BURXY|nr:unnamed protein product [Bursaphelenchus xylophilus]CAG9131156.1 unnamed protein product [Bursaphelenchus xylophilus]